MKTTFGESSDNGEWEGYGLAKITVELVAIFRAKNAMQINDRITHDDVEEMLGMIREKIYTYEDLSPKK